MMRLQHKFALNKIQILVQGLEFESCIKKERKQAISKAKANPPKASALLKTVESSLDDDKADGAVVIELFGKTDIADYMVVASGTSQRHISTMATHLRENLRAKGFKGVTIEGETQCDWVLIDAGDVVVHLFRPDIRDFYGLEKLWGDSKQADQSSQELLA